MSELNLKGKNKPIHQMVRIEGTLHDPASISTECIRAEYVRRGLEVQPRPMPTQEIEEAYRLIAENRNSEAMEILARAFPKLAPPVPRMQDRRLVVLQ